MSKSEDSELEQLRRENKALRSRIQSSNVLQSDIVSVFIIIMIHANIHSFLRGKSQRLISMMDI